MEIALKFLGLIASIVATYKLLSDVVINKKSRLRDEYQFVKQYLADIAIDDKKDIHPLLIEKGYFAISGKYLRSNEILHLLNFPNPTLSLKNYSSATKYIEISKGESDFTYIKKYKSSNKRKYLSIWYFSSYFILAFIGFSPLFIGSIIGIEFNLQTVISSLAFMVAFIFLAGVQLVSLGEIHAAKFILDIQNNEQNS